MSYDNACKYLAEEYPADFVRWLLEIDTEEIQVLKTELTPEPIRADAVTFIQVSNRLLHLEFQTLPYSTPPIPFRMLDYYVRLKRQYNCAIEQVVIFLQETTSELSRVDYYEDTNTRHRYRVVRLWEQNPALFLNNPGLLPFAPLTQTDSPQTLLAQVAGQVAEVEALTQQENLSVCTGILAGLRFDTNLIQQLFRRDIMRESAFYQDILAEGLQQGEATLILRQLRRRFGSITPKIEAQIQTLTIPQLEALAEALLDFTDVTALTTWLREQV